MAVNSEKELLRYLRSRYADEQACSSLKYYLSHPNPIGLREESSSGLPFSEFEHEIGGKTLRISFDLLLQSLCLSTIELSQVGIDDNPLPSNSDDTALKLWGISVHIHVCPSLLA